MYNIPIILYFACISHSNGWGREGHYVTARIAEAFLNAPARRLVESLLGVDSLSTGQPFYDAAAWADQMHSDPAYAWSQPLHFINTQYRVCDGFDLNRDCPSSINGKGCLVTGINNYTERLANVSLTNAERAEALKFLIHFIADVNQPLHVGFGTDKGGNKVNVFPPWDHKTDKMGKVIKAPRLKPLHVLWDSHMIQFSYIIANATWKDIADRLIDEMKLDFLTQVRAFTDPYDPFKRANESLALACSFAYKENGSWITAAQKLSLPYYHTRSKISMEQLAKSGLDIASTLNKIAETIEWVVQASLTTWDAAEVSANSSMLSHEDVDEYDVFIISP
jgi:hypothetical protein